MSSRDVETSPLATWSERLARRVAPDEIDLAPDLAVAYATGGADRRALFDGPRADPGAFGAGAAMFLPVVFDALAASYTVVKGFLGDPAVGSLLATASLVAAVRSRRAGTGAPRTNPPGEDAEVARRADAAVEEVRSQLEAKGAPSDLAADAAVSAVGVLAEDPAGAMLFLDDLARPPLP
ncbi:MAG: hypothetical protein L0H64_15665 [Pseudonocardia sp.]|nr:hypothetical protein [Pseudonocardia sp.]